MKTAQKKTSLALISRIQTEYSEVLAKIKKKIKTEEELFIATDLLLKVRMTFNEWDGKRTERTAPANETIRLINEDYFQILKPLEEIEKELKVSIENYANEKIDKDLIELEKLRKKTNDKTLTTPIGLSVIPSSFGEIRFRKNQIVKIIDEKKVPKKYFVIDIKAIEKDSKTQSIPGVEIMQTSKATVYAK